jgi:archaetidylinositol phosphate synthase
MHPMEHKDAVRVQTSFLSRVEKKALVAMATRMPVAINSDHLTLLGLAGAILSGAGYVLSNVSIEYLWLASAGLIINWFGDSLDGTVARTRNAQRPIYGFFIDHNIDAITITIICVGAGLSPLISFPVAMLVLAAYLMLSIFTYINTFLRGEFIISYNHFGPTEFRIIIIAVNTLFYFVPIVGKPITFFNQAYTWFDVAGMLIAAVLFVVYLTQFFQDLTKYAKVDPPHKFYNKK